MQLQQQNKNNTGTIRWNLSVAVHKCTWNSVVTFQSPQSTSQQLTQRKWTQGRTITVTLVHFIKSRARFAAIGSQLNAFVWWYGSESIYIELDEIV